MDERSIVFTVFLIFSGAAVFSTMALYARQSLLVAYMMFGILFGPWGLRLVNDISLIDKIDDIGIIFLMFLLGLHLHPQNLLRMLSKTTWITVLSSAFFFAVGFSVSYWYGYDILRSVMIGACVIFSSTIVSLKLLPLKSVRHQRVGELMVSILLLQDLIAIMVLLVLKAMGNGKLNFSEIGLIILSFPGILVFVFFVERFILNRIFAKFREVREYIFLVAIAWCLGIAVLAREAGLSYEIGAFVAGISIAASPIATKIAEQLKPLRDFFMVLFFFVIGAGLNLQYLRNIWFPALILVIIFLFLKPAVFKFLLQKTGEVPHVAAEVGVRLGQFSEFSLLIILLANENKLVDNSVACLVQAITMGMFIVSSYLTVMRCPGAQKDMEKISVV